MALKENLLLAHQMKDWKLRAWLLLFYPALCLFWVWQVALPAAYSLIYQGSALAIITSAKRTGSRKYPSCRIEYHFSVDGIPYVGPSIGSTELERSCPEIGSLMDIRYALDNPAANTWAMSYNVNFTTILITFAIAFFTLGVAIYIASYFVWRQHQRKTA